MDDRSLHAGPLVFGDFLEHLRRQGFTVGVDDYLRLQELLNKIGDCAPVDLKTLLCPILATNKIQQQQFYAAFDSYFDLFQPASAARPPMPADRPRAADGPSSSGARKKFYVLASALLLGLALALAFVLWPRPTAPVVTSPVANQNAAPAGGEQVKNSNAPQGPAQAAAQNPPEGAVAPPPAPPPEAVPQQRFYRRYGTAIHLSSIIAPFVFFLFYEWYRLRRRQLMLEKQRLRKPPFVWPLTVEAPAARLYDPQQLYTVARLMRRRQMGEFYRLDIAATVSATIAARGYPDFRYQRDSRPPEYLMLIERRSFRDHQARLFDELIRALEREGLFIRRYYYEGDPRVCQNETEGSTDLVNLRSKCADHRLLIFGDGEKLINPVTGKLEAWAGLFAEWPERALLTPVASSRWGLREITLADQFVLRPATLAGLLAVVDSFELPAATDLRAWQRDGAEAPPADLESPGVVERLRRYLGSDLFQWLCACAVYTEMHWDLTLYLAALACMPQGLITADNLLKLIRLPWFRSGAMPDELRWQLICELDREKEKAIRAAIVGLMEKNPPPRETFAEDNYQLNLVVQRWLSRGERKRRRALLQALKPLPPNRAVRDYTLLRALESTRLSPVDFLLPRRLRQLFYRHGLPAFGLRTELRLLAALGLSAVAVLVYYAQYRPATLSGPHVTRFSDTDLGLRNIATRSNSGSCFDCHGITRTMQDQCIDCHRTQAAMVAAFVPTIYDAHEREGIGCATCHEEHRGRGVYAGLVNYDGCAGCHNGSYKVKTGERAGSLLPVPHGGQVGYPVVNGKWEWRLTLDQIRRLGYPDEWASYDPNDQFHAVHQMARLAGRMSCGDCHTRGSYPGADFRNSPKDTCAVCHIISFKTESGSTVQVSCSTCHVEHGQSLLARISQDSDNDPQRLKLYLASLNAGAESANPSDPSAPVITILYNNPDRSSSDKIWADRLQAYLLGQGYAKVTVSKDLERSPVLKTGYVRIYDMQMKPVAEKVLALANTFFLNYTEVGELVGSEPLFRDLPTGQSGNAIRIHVPSLTH